MTEPALTPPQVAKLLGVDPATVIGWIRSGELRAYNVGSRRSMRPSYRIDPDALEQFKKLRQVIPPPPRTARRKRRDNDVIEFF
jgi:excisionase family DNA binding protein